MWTVRYHRAVRWARRVRERRRARLAAVRDFDDYLLRVAYGLRDSGEPYDTWRRSLPQPRTAGGVPPA